MDNIYAARISELRSAMVENGWDAVIITGTDPHNSEYPADRWKQVQWISGFTGEAGDIVITSDHAGLWTDTRYFIQAEQQLRGTGIELHKTRVPEQILIPEWLCAKFTKGSPVTIAVDGLCQSVGTIEDMKDKLAKAYGDTGYSIVDIPDLMSGFWKDRPDIPVSEVTFINEALVGEKRKEKLSWLRAEMLGKGCSSVLISSLDEIAWLLNVRGNDIEYNPYVISHLLVTEKRAIWFVRNVDTVPQVDEIINADYGTLEDGLNDIRDLGAIMVDPSSLNYNVSSMLRSIFPDDRIKYVNSAVKLRKSVKNSTEIAAEKKAYIEDGLALEKFLFWLENQVKSGIAVSEWEASERLTSLRGAIPGFHGNSFDNISAYEQNAALPHYVTEKKNSTIIKKKGLYLIDSGGHYDFGTTDTTRTVPMGRCSRLQKEDYTLVLKGMIDFSMARFPKGTACCRIDALAREPLWFAGRNFGHGTGHGIGFYLGVHEGPQDFRQNLNGQEILPGMITSVEPGLYREGKYGIRHENVVLCVNEGKSEFGEWLGFETLTRCHIDTGAIKKKMLTKAEKKWLNEYNKLVYKTLKEMLDPATAKWLKKKCHKIR